MEKGERIIYHPPVVVGIPPEKIAHSMLNSSLEYNQSKVL